MSQWTDHACAFPEVDILDHNPGDQLTAGMKVLAPCECGETPLDHLASLTTNLAESDAALLAVEPSRTLFHWAPTARRKQIIRYGLRPKMRGTTSDVSGAPVVCLADSPSWAWALSGGMSFTPTGTWDLWQTELADLTDPVVLPSPDRATGIYEVRTEHRIHKRHLWHVGTRVKV